MGSNRTAITNVAWDIALRVGALEAALGGRKWPRDSRGLERARAVAEQEKARVDEDWFSTRDQGIYTSLLAKAKKMMNSEQDAEDILGDLLAEHAMKIAAANSTSIRKGSWKPRNYRNILLIKLQQLGIDLMRHHGVRWDAHGNALEVGGVVQTEEGFTTTDAPSTHLFNVQTDWDLLLSTMRGPTGRVLRDWLREIWSGPGFGDVERAVLLYRLDNPHLKQKDIAAEFGLSVQHTANIFAKAKKVSKKRLKEDVSMQKFLDRRMELSELGVGGRTASTTRVAWLYLAAKLIDALCSGE